MVGVASQPSVAVALPVLAGAELAVHWMVTLAGQLTKGAALSSTVTICIQLLELPQSSIATHVLVIVYPCGHPAPIVTSEKETVGVPSQLSVAVAVPVFPGAELSLHSIVTLAGQDINGAVLSSTKIV
jgi:hypothetical protein